VTIWTFRDGRVRQCRSICVSLSIRRELQAVTGVGCYAMPCLFYPAQRDCPRLASIWVMYGLLPHIGRSARYCTSGSVASIKALIIFSWLKRSSLSSLAKPSSENSARFHPVFTSLDFTTVFFFYSESSSALCSTPNVEGQVPVFMFPSDRVAQL
jgi:hypothetical protein